METRIPYEIGEQICRKVLAQNRTRLVVDLDPNELVDAFIEEDFITSVQARDIRDETKTSDRNRRILEIVSTKGVEGYETFKMCLKKSHQELLVKVLEKTEAELTDQDKAKDVETTLTVSGEGEQVSSASTGANGSTPNK